MWSSVEKPRDIATRLLKEGIQMKIKNMMKLLIYRDALMAFLSQQFQEVLLKESLKHMFEK